MAWVAHSAKATTRACGNADCSPLFTPGRPKNASFSAVSATIQTGPVDRDQPATGHPSRAVAPAAGSTPIGAGDPLEQRLQRLRPKPRPGLEDRRLRSATRAAPASPRPTPARQSTEPAHPHRSRRNTTPSRSRSTPSPAPADSGCAAPCAPPQRSPHQPAPAGTPASTPPPTPDPTTDDPTPASPTPHAACTQTTLM